MARQRPAIDQSLFVGVITPTNLNEVKEQPHMIGYRGQAVAVLQAVQHLLSTQDSEPLTLLKNVAEAAQTESSLTVQEYYVGQMRIFADLYYDEVEKRAAPNEYSPEAMVDTIKADQDYNAKALRVQRSAVRRMDVLLRMTRPLPESTMRKLNAEIVNGTLIVMRNKPVLVCRHSYERYHEFMRARDRAKGKLDNHLLLTEFHIPQRFQRNVNVSWLATREEVVHLSDNRVLSIGLTTSTTQEPRYKTLASRVESEVNTALAPHRHLVSEHSRQYLLRAALNTAALDAHKAALRAAREARIEKTNKAKIAPGRTALTGRAATLVAAMRTELAELVAHACMVQAGEAVSALEHNGAASMARMAIGARTDLDMNAKRLLLRDVLKVIARWHKLRTASERGVDPTKISLLLRHPLPERRV